MARQIKKTAGAGSCRGGHELGFAGNLAEGPIVAKEAWELSSLFRFMASCTAANQRIAKLPASIDGAANWRYY